MCKCFVYVFNCVGCYFLLCFLVGNAFTKDYSRALRDTAHLASPEFSRHRVVKPLVHHARDKRQITTSTMLNKDGLHEPELTVTLDVDGVDYVLDLRLNRDLIPSNHTIMYQKEGKTVSFSPSHKETQLCQYLGSVRGMKDSWVALSTCQGLRGMIYDGNSTKYIQAGLASDLESEHFLYDHSHLTAEMPCGYEGGITDNVDFDKEHHEKHRHKFTLGKETEFNRILRYKRETEQTEVRGPYNSNKLSRYVELVLVIDHKEYKALGENLNTVHGHCKDIANIMNMLYSPLNIFIALVGVVVWTERDEIELSENGDTTLTNFLHYRRKTLIKQIANDNAQLLTREQFASGVVGKALKGPICTFEFSGGVSVDHSNVVGLVATTIAHEMGHNFGMEHDTSECACPGERCIMSPSSTSQTPTHWSQCSLEYLALAFEHGMDYCLRNKPLSLFESPTCGNGFVEPGEQCDCGIGPRAAEGACAACCHEDTCMLRHNATCATGHCCDLKTCRPSTAGTMCRTADHECDLPEYCTGQSEFCPDDIYKMDTEPCNHGKAFCYHGSCRTRTDQCRLLWGPSGESSDNECYKMNKKGSMHGNCGYNRQKQSYATCVSQDIFCGMLHCKHLNERLEFGMESVAILTHSFINNRGSIIPCRTAIVDLGVNEVDPGLVPDGAKCGNKKMCVNQKCMEVSALRLSPAGADPTTDCSGHGVRNSLGHCHCEKGFSPPNCELPGPGGSEDSGPASDPNAYRSFMIALYVIFLGIIPSVLLLLFLSYYSRHNIVIWWKKPRKPSKSPIKNGLQRRLSRGASRLASTFHSTSHPPPTASLPIPTTPNTPADDMSSSLLPTDSSSPAAINPGFFGNFKGFSLTPIEKTQIENAHDTSNSQSNPTSSKNNPNAYPSKDGPVAVISSFANSQNGNCAKANLKSAKINPVNRSNSQSFANGIQNIKHSLRSAPPVPSVPVIGKVNQSVENKSDTVQDRIRALITIDKPENTHEPFQPVNAVSNNARPSISSPILEASTCTAKELISPLHHSSNSSFGSKTLGPVRPAPEVPGTISPELPKRPLSIGNVLSKPLPEEPLLKKHKEGISLNRIASFLKQDKSIKEKMRSPVERSHSLPKNPNHLIRLNKAGIDKVALRNLQISNPILQKDIDLPSSTVPVVSNSEDLDDPSTMIVSRAQSMRGPTIAKKPSFPAFGSMKQPSGFMRPTSIATNSRPKSPPPPRPHDSTDNPQISCLPGYQVPPAKPIAVAEKSPEYADCMGEKQAPLANINEESPTDNIYAVIEESPPIKTDARTNNSFKTLSVNASATNNNSPPGYNAPKPTGGKNSGSSESMGLLGEIVSEIQCRNFDSIYSTSTLARKKRERELKEGILSDDDTDSTYINTDYKSPDSEYSNVGGVKSISSAASTTSSGYLSPAAVNVPQFPHRSIVNDNSNKTEPIANNLTMKSFPLSRPSLTSTFKTPETIEKVPLNIPEDKASLQLLQTPSSPTQKGHTKIPMLNRQPTPPGITRITTPLAVVAPQQNSKNQHKPLAKTSSSGTPNSPDLISSCAVLNNAKTEKSPDVLNGSTTKSTDVEKSKLVLTNNKSVPSKPPSLPKPNVETNKPSLKPAPPPPNDKKNLQTKLNSSQKSINSLSSGNLQRQGSMEKSVVKNGNKDLMKVTVDKAKPKTVPKPSLPAQRTDLNVNKTTSAVKPTLNSRSSNVANLQQKFESRKSVTSKVDTGNFKK